MCGFVLSYISGTAGVQLSTSSSAPHCTGTAVSVATKHEVCFGACVAVGERLAFTMSALSHSRSLLFRQSPSTAVY